MQLADFLRLQAHANRLANHRLHQALLVLNDAELRAPRTSFFPSLLQTAQHIWWVDGFYIGALLREADLASYWERVQPPVAMAELARAQAESDARLIRYCSALDDSLCAEGVAIPRSGGRVQRDLVVYVLGHLFQHQTHHRGQLHAMLSGTRVAPPQLDEFQMSSEAHLRLADMAALGWREDDVWPAACAAPAPPTAP